MRTLAFLALALLLLPTPAAWTAQGRYRIETRSPDSWAHYYQLIGLGRVDRGPHSQSDWQALFSHCDFLEAQTGQPWIPLGYSIDRGYMLCFRTGPFSASEAKVMCARLVMYVVDNVGDHIVCEKKKDNLLHPGENPYYRF